MWRHLSAMFTRGPARPTRAAPRLEALEDRAVPATYAVTTTLDDVTAGDGKQSLREAITRANDHPGADVIVVPAGVFAIALKGENEDGNATGDFDVTDSVTIVGQGAVQTIVHGVHLDRVFHVLGSAPSSIRVNFRGLTIAGGSAFDGAGLLMGNADVTLRGCLVQSNSATWSGGGISNLSHPLTGNLTMIGTTVSHNESASGDGGGVYLHGGTLTGQRSRVTGNQAASSGGGIAATTVALTGCTVNWNESTLWGGGVSTTAVTLNGCAVTDNRAGGDGGGVYAGPGGAILTRSTVTRNVSNGDGGGVFVVDGSLTASRSVLRGNYAERDGGGAYTGTSTLTGCVVAGNAAARFGGGVYAGLTGTLTGCTVSDNLARDAGGGIYAGDAFLFSSRVDRNGAETSGGGIRGNKVNLTNCTVSGNFANTFRGGGIWASETADLTSSTVSGNSAGLHGGGIWALKTTTLTNSTVSGNRAEEFGGGVDTGEGIFVNVTIAKNIAGYGGGVAIDQGSFLNVTIAENIARYGGGGVHREGTTGTLTVKNSLIALNLVSLRLDGPADVSGTFDSQGHNFIGVVDGGTGFGAPGDLLGNLDNRLDPFLGELRNNGGKTQTYALLAGSFAIDAGDNDGASAFDQRGIRRPRDGNGDGVRTVDIGAFER